MPVQLPVPLAAPRPAPVRCGLMRKACCRNRCADLLVEDDTERYFPEFKRTTIEMIVAQGAIVGWCAASAQVLQALEAAGRA